MLSPVFNPFDGALQQKRCRRDRNLLGIDNEFCAKSAANVGRHDADAIFVEAEHLHDEIASFVGELRGGPDSQQIARGIVARDNSAALDRMGATAVLL